MNKIVPLKRGFYHPKLICAFLVGAFALVGSGCASAGRIGSLPIIPEGTASSEIVLVRPSSIVGAANSYYIALDGHDIFSIRSGQHTAIRIPSGEHFISVKCFGGWTPTWKGSAKPVKASAGETLYFKISPNLSCAEIEQVSADAGKQMVSKASFISAEVPSSKS